MSLVPKELKNLNKYNIFIQIEVIKTEEIHAGDFRNM